MAKETKEDAFFNAFADAEEGLEIELASDQEPVTDVISTGSLSLDDALFCGGLPAGRIIQFYGPAGCHIKGQQIMMADGSLKAVEKIVVGDKLMGPDSTPRTVLELRRGYGKMYNIKPIKGKSFVVNEDHILTLTRNNSELLKNFNSKRELVDVSVKEWLSFAPSRKKAHKLVRTSVKKFASDTRNLPIDPYMLGVLLGDGSIQRGVELTTASPEILSVFTSFSRKNGLRLVPKATSGKSRTYSASGTKWETNKVFSKIKALGINVKCENKFIPQAYKTTSIESRLEILAGILDTDGHMSGAGFDYISKSEKLANDVAFIARSVGLAAYVSEVYKSAYIGHVGTYYRVSISGDCSIIPNKIDYKKAPKRKQTKNVLHTGFDVEYVGMDNYYGFLLDKDHRYLMDDFTITHNSGKTLMTMIAMIEAQKKDPDAKQLFIDAEGSFNRDWAETLGLDLSRVQRVHGPAASNGRKVFEMLVGKPKKDAKGLPSGKSAPGFFDMVKSGDMNFNLVILDSLGVIIPPQEDTSEVGKANMALMARFLGTELKKVSVEAQRANVPMILINHVRDQMDMFAPTKYTYTGGNQLKHQLSINILFEPVQRKDSQILDTDENKVGHTIRATIEKNKFGPWPRKVEFKVHFDKGVVDKEEELLTLATDYEIVNRPNNRSYTYNDQKWDGREKAIEALKDETLYAELANKVADARRSAVEAKKIKK